jgi:hypothetical protein
LLQEWDLGRSCDEIDEIPSVRSHPAFCNLVVAAELSAGGEEYSATREPLARLEALTRCG